MKHVVVILKKAIEALRSITGPFLLFVIVLIPLCAISIYEYFEFRLSKGRMRSVIYDSHYSQEILEKSPDILTPSRLKVCYLALGKYLAMPLFYIVGWLCLATSAVILLP